MVSRLRGFTILELLVVLVIASLAIGVVGPRLMGVIPGTELKTSTQEVAALVRQARSEAIMHSRETWLAVVQDEESEEVRLRVAGWPQGYRWPASVALRLQEGESALWSTEVPRISFFPDGSSSGGSITLTGAAGRYQIQVDALTGRIWIEG